MRLRQAIHSISSRTAVAAVCMTSQPPQCDIGALCIYLTTVQAAVSMFCAGAPLHDCTVGITYDERFNEGSANLCLPCVDWHQSSCATSGMVVSLTLQQGMQTPGTATRDSAPGQ